MSGTRQVSVRLKYVVVAAMVAIVASCAPATEGTGATAPGQPTWQLTMLNSLNDIRSEAGVGPVFFCPNLAKAAQAHSEDQAAMNSMSHSGSNGSNIGARANASGYVNWATLGENVAVGQTSVSSVLSAWMDSPGHRENMLNGSYTHFGMGKGISASGRPYWTQDFGAGGSC